MTWWDKVRAWMRAYWQWIVAGLGAAAAFLGALVAIRQKRQAPPQVAAPLAVDPAPALAPLADIGPQVDKIEAVVRDDAARDAEDAKEAHDAIDAADSIAAVNAVLYGVPKPDEGGGRPARAPDDGAAPAQRVSDTVRRR